MNCGGGDASLHMEDTPLETELPKMIMRQLTRRSRLEKQLVMQVWHTRAAHYELDARGLVPTLNAMSKVRPLSKRSVLYTTVSVLLDHLARQHAGTVHVLVFGEGEPLIVRLPAEVIS